MSDYSLKNFSHCLFFSSFNYLVSFQIIMNFVRGVKFLIVLSKSPLFLPLSYLHLFHRPPTSLLKATLATFTTFSLFSISSPVSLSSEGQRKQDRQNMCKEQRVKKKWWIRNSEVKREIKKEQNTSGTNKPNHYLSSANWL